MNVIVSLISRYTQLHGGMSLEFLAELCKESGWRGVFFSTVHTEHEHYDNYDIYAVSLEDFKSGGINTQCMQFVKSCMPPDTDFIFNFQDVYFWKYLRCLYSPDRIVVFTRIFINELLSAINEYNNSSCEATTAFYKHLRCDELDYINSCRAIVCAAPSVSEILQYKYGVDPDRIKVIKSFSSKIPTLLNMPVNAVPDTNKILIAGRNDFQKGGFRLAGDTAPFEIVSHTHGFELFTPAPDLNWETVINRSWYLGHAHIPFMAFPAIYETRGMVLQECMALGKIPLVSLESPGLIEQIIPNCTGFIVDFDSSNWAARLSVKIKSINIKIMQDRVRNQIRHNYYRSPFMPNLISFLKGICA